MLNKIEIVYFRADYLLHSLLFLPWMILVAFHLNRKNIKRKLYSRYLFYWFLAGISLAVLAEVIQLWLSYRSFNLMDVVFNVGGVVLGGVVTAIYWYVIRNQKSDVKAAGKKIDN